MATLMGVNIVVAERCLNQSLGGLVAIYNQHGYLGERCAVLQKCCAVLGDFERGEVV